MYKRKQYSIHLKCIQNTYTIYIYITYRLYPLWGYIMHFQGVGEGGRGSRVFIVILTYWVGFLVGFVFSYTVRIPQRCYGYILLAYIIGQ